MELAIIIDYLIISIVASMAINSLLQSYAKKHHLLVDLPDRSRKFHKRPTPLTGGIGIFLSILISGKLYMDLNNLNGYMPDFTYQLMTISIPLICLFLLDDLKELKPYQRLIAQALSCAYVIFTTDIYLENLGDLFGFGNIELGLFGIPFTIFCAVGLMNAFNMIDGMNGLCAGCAMLSLLLIGFHSEFIYDSMLILIIGSMIGFLLFNLTIFGKQRGVFLGDHGSNLIGFWVAWSAIYVSQNVAYNTEPITMVWFVAIPLLDCIGLIFSRTNKGISWAKPGRDHIHHKLMSAFSQQISLMIILTISLSLGMIGIKLENYYSPWVSFIAFIIFASVYFIFAHFYGKGYLLNIKKNA
jgi:UDP-GlcNAc:undecaprenyl-phosphate/decaprenyl-phosphate GlcNAc-1-phosphate transferase